MPDERYVIDVLVDILNGEPGFSAQPWKTYPFSPFFFSRMRYTSQWHWPPRDYESCLFCTIFVHGLVGLTHGLNLIHILWCMSFRAIKMIPPSSHQFWQRVASDVGTRSEWECQQMHQGRLEGTSKASRKTQSGTQGAPKQTKGENRDTVYAFDVAKIIVKIIR